MSVFRRLYDFVESASDPRYLNDLEQHECFVFAGLVPLLFSDMRKKWSEKLLATDASPGGYGICETDILPQEAS